MWRAGENYFYNHTAWRNVSICHAWPRPASIHNRIHLGKQRLIQMQQKLLFVSLFEIRLIHSSLMHYVSSLPSFRLINDQAIFLHCIYILSCTHSTGCNVEYWRDPYSLKEFVRTYREAAGQCPVYWHLMQLSTEDQDPAHPQWLFHYGTKQFCDIYRRHVTPHHGAPWYNSPGYNAQLGRRLWLDCRELGSLDITLNLTFFFVTD